MAAMILTLTHSEVDTDEQELLYRRAFWVIDFNLERMEFASFCSLKASSCWLFYFSPFFSSFEMFCFFFL